MSNLAALRKGSVALRAEPYREPDGVARPGGEQALALGGRQREAVPVVHRRQLRLGGRLASRLQALGRAEARVRMAALCGRNAPAGQRRGIRAGDRSAPRCARRTVLPPGGGRARGTAPAAGSARTGRAARPRRDLFPQTWQVGARLWSGSALPGSKRQPPGAAGPSSIRMPTHSRAWVICSTAPGTVRVCRRRTPRGLPERTSSAEANGVPSRRRGDGARTWSVSSMRSTMALPAPCWRAKA